MENKISIHITEGYFGGVEGIRSILNNYYEREMEKLPSGDQDTARIFIEEGLIVSKRRVLVSEGVEKENFGVEEELLKKLLDSRLIRTENTHLGKSYELSHDTLVDPILKSFEKRQAEIQKIEAQRQLAEQQALAKKERRKRMFWVATAMTGFALFFFALFQMYLANEATLKMEEADRLKERMSLEKDSSTYLLLYTNGIDEMEKRNFLSAVNYFENARDYINDWHNLDSMINECNLRSHQKDSYEKLLVEAGKAQQSGFFTRALDLLAAAGEKAFDDQSKEEVKSRKTLITLELLNEFKKLVDQGNQIHKLSQSCEHAMTAIRKADNMVKYLENENIHEYKMVILSVKRKCN